MVIHMDPVSVDNEEVKKLNMYLNQLIQDSKKDVSFHDLRITQGEKNVNVIFDLSIPYSFSNLEKNDYITYIQDKIKELDEKYSPVINIDYH